MAFQPPYRVPRCNRRLARRSSDFSSGPLLKTARWPGPSIRPPTSALPRLASSCTLLRHLVGSRQSPPPEGVQNSALRNKVMMCKEFGPYKYRPTRGAASLSTRNDTRDYAAMVTRVTSAQVMKASSSSSRSSGSEALGCTEYDQGKPGWLWVQPRYFPGGEFVRVWGHLSYLKTLRAARQARRFHRGTGQLFRGQHARLPRSAVRSPGGHSLRWF